MIAVVLIGILALLALPAFRRVRANSQDKAVLSNLRQMANAADEYFLQNGKTRAFYSEIVGSGKYINVVRTVAGEVYPTVFRSNLRQYTASGVAGQRTITYRH